MQLQNSIPWPPQPKNLEPEKFTLQNKLKLIKKLLLNGKDVQSSLGQEIIIKPQNGE